MKDAEELIKIKTSMERTEQRFRFAMGSIEGINAKLSTAINRLSEIERVANLLVALNVIVIVMLIYVIIK